MKLNNPWLDKLVRIELGRKDRTAVNLLFSNFSFSDGVFFTWWLAHITYTLTGMACAHSKRGQSKNLILVWSGHSNNLKFKVGDACRVYIEMGKTWPRELRINKENNGKIHYLYRFMG